MSKTNLLQKFAPIGVAAFGVISFTGIAAVPVQAGQLSFEDGTDEFFDQFTPVPADGQFRPEPLVGDTVTFTFSPGDEAVISTATDEFVGGGLFPEVTPGDPLVIVDVDAVEATFEFIGPDVDPIIGIYQLVDDDLTFNFPDNGTQVTYGEESIFFFEYDFAPDGTTIEGIEGELEIAAAGTNVNINGDSYTFGGEDELTGITLTFDEPAGGIAGEYSAGVTVQEGGVHVPEPATILGLFAVGGLGLSLKCKKQS